MYIEILDDNKYAIGMKIYIHEAIKYFDNDMSTKWSSPENKDLQKFNLDSPTLPKN